MSDKERTQLSGSLAPHAIRALERRDAPRWGFADVEAYYREASPLQQLMRGSDRLPPTLLLQALDDPWVPAASAQKLSAGLSDASPIRQTFSQHGGHNGFHGRGGCWGDQLAVRWLEEVVA